MVKSNPFAPPAVTQETSWELGQFGEAMLFAVPMGVAPMATFLVVGSYVEAHSHYLSLASFATGIWAGGVVLAVMSILEFGLYCWRRPDDEQ